jgi:integrase
MPRAKLTQLTVDRLGPPTTGSVVHWDAQLRGFGLRVSSKGRKTWIATYRVNRKPVMESFGTTVLIRNVGEARDRARRSMDLARSGINPVEQKRGLAAAAQAEAAASELTFAKLVDDFVAKYAIVNQKASTLYQTKRLLARATAVWAERPAREIRKGDVLELLDDIADHRRRPRARGGDRPLREAKAVQVCLGTLFRWAVQEDKIEANPMLEISKKRFGRATERERVLTDDELRAFWTVMDQIGWPFGPIGKLLLLTGQRRSEVAGLRWPELNPTHEVWTIPGERTRTKNGREHIVHISAQARAILAELHEFAGVDNLLFPTRKGTTQQSGIGNIKRRVDESMAVELAKVGCEFKHWTWHDLRRTATTLMAERLKIAPHVVDKILNHKSGTIKGVAGIYNRGKYLDERKSALEEWGRYVVDDLVRHTAVNDVELRRSA